MSVLGLDVFVLFAWERIFGFVPLLFPVGRLLFPVFCSVHEGCHHKDNRFVRSQHPQHSIEDTNTMSATVGKDKVKGSLYGLLVGDALAISGHWFYSPNKIREAYGGDIEGMEAPKPHHAESMVMGMSYGGTIDIMHDKAHLYEGHRAAAVATRLSPEEIAKRRDDHGNYVGAVETERPHYHQSLQKGQNSANCCIARLAMRYVAEKNMAVPDSYDPYEFLDRLYTYMTNKPDADDTDQLINHNDTYLDVFLRGFFRNASSGKALRDCAMSQRDTWSIGSLDGAVMSVPIIAAYATEPEAVVIGRAVEHHMLTHRSVTVTATVSVLVPLLLQLYRGADLRESLDAAMEKMRPPKVTGTEMRNSYISNRGPGNIPKHEKWLQHMTLVENETTKDFVHRMIAECDNDEVVAGWGDQEYSRLSTACYCEQTFTVVLYLAYKYADDPRKCLLQNVMIGGHSTARGSILGAILGAAYGPDGLPFVNDLCAKDAITKEIDALVGTL